MILLMMMMLLSLPAVIVMDAGNDTPHNVHIQPR